MEGRHSSMAEVEGVESLGNKVLESKTGGRSKSQIMGCRVP